ncbi:MAG: SMI1/KNR4 family protein [Planctomycetes bacterium]|nr:SMI1/KNR4 family protein [Planctomycetota bacterium]
MPEVKWASIFDEVLDHPDGADDNVIEAFLSTVQQPLSDGELAWLNDIQPEPVRWKIPDDPIPASYLSFLRWSNGGEFRNGERLLQFLPALDAVHGVRVTMLAYGVPYFKPGILPFAFNGGGIFYAFDMRLKAPASGEFPIVAAECGGLPGAIFPLADTFVAACRDKRSIEDLRDEEEEITRPMCDECGEYLVCPECGRRGPTSLE